MHSVSESIVNVYMRFSLPLAQPHWFTQHLSISMETAIHKHWWVDMVQKHKGHLIIKTQTTSHWAKNNKFGCILRVFKCLFLTCSMPTISTLLKKMKECRVDSMFSSNTEGVGSTMSWMYCTRYVWCIFWRSSGSEMGITSLKRAVLVRNSRCRRGCGSAGSNSRQPMTSMMHSSENITSKSAVRFSRKMPLIISYSWCSPSRFSKSSHTRNSSRSLRM